MLLKEEKKLIQKIRAQWEFWFKKQNISQLLHLYISLDCSNSQNYSEGSRYQLNKARQDFLEHRDQRVLLVLGDSGSGKTSLTLKLEQSYWKTHSAIETMNGYVPIRIELKSYTTKTISSCIEDTLEKRYELSKENINQLKKSKNIKLLIIFDGYDEVGVRAEFNIYRETRLSEWKCEIKTIVTCRSQHFTGEAEFKKRFVLYQEQANEILSESLKIIYVAPFSEAQMNEYLIQYLEEDVKKKDTDTFPLKSIQELLKGQLEFKTLLSNPFVLKIFSKVVPKLLKVTSTSETRRALRINRAEIYQSFLEDWFLREKARLESSIRNSEVRDKVKDVEKYFYGYSQRLAFAYFREGITELRYEDRASSGDEPEEYRVIQEGNAAFKEFFGSENSEVVEAKKACPLRRIGESTYSFVHKSFQDYLAARHLYLVLKSGNEKLTIESWNVGYLSEERAVLRFLSEIVENDEKKKSLEEQLLQIIQISSQSETIDRASSNAISVLNWNRYSFSGMDLRGIRVPKAYLEGVNFLGADLRRGNLRGSYVRNSEWSESNLEGSDLKELEFGEYPDWEQGSAVKCMVFNGMGTMLATGDYKGYLRLWRYPDGELLQSWEGHRGGINSVSFSVDGKRLASGGGDGAIRIWSVESGEQESVLVGHTSTVTSVSWSLDGKRLASGGEDRMIRMWDVESGECTGVAVFNQKVRSVSFCKSKNRKQEYLGAGIGNGVYVFFVVNSDLDAKPLLVLKWRTEFYLRAQNANLENANIDLMNRRLLEQRGAKKSNDIVSNSTAAAGTQGFFSPENAPSSSRMSIAEPVHSSEVGSTNLNAGLDEDAELQAAITLSLSQFNKK